MAQIKWTEPALNDIDEVAEYIAIDKPGAAKKLVKEIFKTTRRLKNFPESGRRPPELQDTNYRELIVGPCRIFYRVQKTTVYILYVMRSERELRKFLLEDRAKQSG
ncbi:MAG: type II toxin-antitoxin system RelE/ParE family toxin [Gammaproteobacteria bacterium]|jgi:toxin ParE1/3/4|uniref:type II toxin-antitoxin system RelE/ParE family toxin n=1 Tax=Methylotuvimicrobium sp. TaxID=2822413 RepID=UPI001DEC1296|nr:type II toxin-antitoxin system RelE/ParE family toxin [Gammaproteobacteria bacterium]